MLVVTILLCLGCHSFAVNNDDEKLVAETTVKANEWTLFEAKVEATRGEKNLKINSIKTVCDFAGNIFTVIECEPTGYYIYHNESGIFTEYSTSAQSPYLDLSEDIFYGGPTYYYVKNGENYIHTVLGTNIPVSKTTEMSDVCNKKVEQLLEDNDRLIVNAVNSRSLISKNDQVVQNSVRANEVHYVPNDNIIRNMTGDNVGFYLPNPDSNGVCGYIAANMLLRYWDARGAINLASKYTTSYAVKNAVLSKELRRVGGLHNYDDATTAIEISNVINHFAKENDIPAKSGWGIGNFNIWGEIDKGRPSIVFGDLYNVGFHAVLAYGYEKIGLAYNTFANFGWADAGYEEVVIYGTIGSNVNYKPL